MIGIVLIVISLQFTCSETEEAPITFVKAENGKLVLAGKPYYYFGANFWHGAYLGADIVSGDRERLLEELDILKNYGITNLRVMAASELSDLEMSVKPAFIEKPGLENEHLLTGLDFLLSEMGKRNMKAVLVLNNYWQWSGGMAQYTNWVTGEEVIDPDKTGDWNGFQFQSAAFYSDSAANALFRNYVEVLVNRKNTITQTLYKNDPVIMSWQLANEPRPAPDVNENPEAEKAFCDWIHETAKYIHSLDSNHLVSSGNEGSAGCRDNLDIYFKAHQSEYIDYLTFHIWPKNWGWYDVKKPEATFERTLENTLNYFANHIAVANRLEKPIVLEEFGLERDKGSFSQNATTQYRDKYLKMIFSSMVDSAQAGSSLAGLNFWAWGGKATAVHDDHIWRVGDSFMGDPPQEPQGLNSVFASDISTLRLFKNYNTQLMQLNN